MPRVPEISSRAAHCIPLRCAGHRRKEASRRPSATSGNGLAATTGLTRATGRRPARSVNITASSCAANTSCAADRAPRRQPTCARPTGISFRRRHAGSFPGCASLGTPESSIADGRQPARRAVMAAPRATRGGSVRIAAMILHFSHANGFPAACYRKMFSFLERDFEIDYIDTIGHEPRHPVTDSWPHLVAELIERLERYREPVLAVGHSLGGYLTMLAALERPELFRAIVVLDSPVIGTWAGRAFGLVKRFGLVDRVTPAGATRDRRSHWKSAEEAYKHFHG